MTPLATSLSSPRCALPASSASSSASSSARCSAVVPSPAPAPAAASSQRCSLSRPTAAVAQIAGRQVQQPQQPQQQARPQQLLPAAQQPSCSRRGLLAALGAAATVGAAASLPAPAAAASALEEYMRLEDENKLKDVKAFDSIRAKFGIRRGSDGRVQLRRKNGSWVSVRLDMEVPGAILLRDSKTSAVFALETDSLPQVDLSDDYVLLMMFADGQWESDMTAIEYEDEQSGKPVQLTMSEREFREFVGILKEAA